MRPLDRAAASEDLDAYARPANLSLGQASVAASRVFGTGQPTSDQCLELWDLAVRGGSLSADESMVLGAVKDAVDREYRAAAWPLVAAFGRQCAYCESPISELVQVEHVLAKSQYPTFALDMDNFLLGCGPCNRRKGNRPDRLTAGAWITHTAHPTPDDYRVAIRDEHHYWADSRPTPTPLPLAFDYHDGSEWIEVAPINLAAGPSVAMTSRPFERPVRADVPALGVSDAVVQVRVAYDPAATPPRAKEAIDLCGLNTVGSGTNDDRVGRRTQTWLDAVALWHSAVPDPANPPSGLSFSFAMAAGNAGHFTVWYTVGELIAPGLGGLFVHETADWFRNTDVGRLP